MPEKTEAAKKTEAKKTEAATNGSDPVRKPSEQALQVVDLAVGTVPTAAEAVRHAVKQLRDSEARAKDLESFQNQIKNLRDSKTRTTQIDSFKKQFSTEVEKTQARGGDVRKQVTDQVVERARKARERVEPTYKKRVEPTYKKRVEPVYTKRVEPTVKRVRERI